MRAFQGYIENGRIIPVDMPQVQDGLRVIITVLDSTQTTFERTLEELRKILCRIIPIFVP
jgi:hypothetical protein